jgi:hypothetical protein
MRRVSLLAAACTALGAFMIVSTASAAYNTPYQAKRVNSGMVTAYNKCTAPTLLHRPSLAVPACVPTQSSANNPANVYSFGTVGSTPNRSGSARVKLQSTNGDVRISVSSKDIWKNGSGYSGNALTGTAIVRTTDNGCGGAFDVDCTIVDFPFPADLTCTFGSCKSASATSNGVLPGAVHGGDKAILDIGQVSILDEDGDAFARGGLVVGRSYANEAFNAPKSTAPKDASMVPAYNQCTVPALTHRPSLALPACAPVQSSANNPANTYTFGQTSTGSDGGWADVTLGRNQVNRDNVRIKVSSKEIWKNGARYSGDDLQVTATIRTTDDGCGGSPYDVDCTMVDIPFPTGLHCNNGSCRSVKQSWNAILPGALNKEDTANIEIGQISILDEDADTVARAGVFVK